MRIEKFDNARAKIEWMHFNFNIKQAKGLILLGEIKKIPIEWEWIYESGENQDIQDTKDGENLRKYEFQICTIGS